MASPRVCVVANPRAASGRLGRTLAALRATLGPDDHFVTPDGDEALRDALARAAREGIDRIAVAGGDGTLHRVASALYAVHGDGAWPTLGLLGGGTMNTVAGSLSLRARAPHAVLHALREDAPASITRPTLRCGPRLGFLFGVGVLPTFLDLYYETGDPSFRTAATVLGRSIAEGFTNGPGWQRLNRRHPCRVEFVDGPPLEAVSAFGLAAGTVPDIGLGFKPFARALERDDALHFLAIHTDASGFVRDLPRLLAARPMRPDRGTDRLTQGFTLHMGETPVRYMLDGDPYDHDDGPLEVRVGPRVRLVRPASTLSLRGLR